MSGMDALLARSRSPGAFVERRRFTLARDKAIEKMREYALRDPRQYVLELVQAAVFAGASYIAVDVSPEEVVVAWVDGELLQRSELEDLFQYLFTRQGASQHRHLVQLALGVNALLQRKPRSLRIECGDGTPEGTTRLDLDRRGRATSGLSAEPMLGTYVHASFGGQWLGRFLGERFTPEQGLVETRCRYTPVPILLNGQAPFGYKASRALGGFGGGWSRSFDDGKRRGVIALDEHAERGRVDIVVGGVIITSRALDELGTEPLRGVVCDDSLRKTADQSDIVNDAAWLRLLHSLQPLATELMRRRKGKGWHPPPLPPVPEEREGPVGSVVVPEPLPPTMRQLGLRPPLPLAALRALPPGQPVFWVRPDDAATIGPSADPARFPYPVLLLSPGQALTLDLSLPEHDLGRLATVADADFVRRMLDRHVDEVRAEAALGGTGLPPGRLRLSLRRAGPPRQWGDPREGAVPLLLRVDGEARLADVLPLDLPGMAVAVDLDGPLSDVALEGLAGGGLDRRVLYEARRLVLADTEGAHSRELLAAVLAAHLQPHFVEEAGVLRLEGALPGDWGPAAGALLDRPLCSDLAGEALSARRLLELVSAGDRAELASLEELTRLAPLEEHLGWGHLGCAELSGIHLLRAVRAGESWRLVEPEGALPPHVEQVLWIALDGDTTRLPAPGWRPGRSGVAAVGAATHQGHAAQDPMPGLALLFQRLFATWRRDDWRLLVRDPEHTARARGLGRVVLLRLAAALDRLRHEELIRTDRGQATSLAQLLAQPHRAVHPRHGVLLDEPWTVSLWLDELRVIREELGPDALPLRFDDPPELWWSLADDGGRGCLEAPEAADWIVRVPVDAQGLTGWLGLRRPVDRTAGIFLQSLGTTVALADLDRELPCHGLLWGLGQDHPPSRRQRQLLRLARTELYAALAGHAAAHPEDADAAAYLEAHARWREQRTRQEAALARGEAVDGAHAGELEGLHLPRWGLRWPRVHHTLATLFGPLLAEEALTLQVQGLGTEGPVAVLGQGEGSFGLLELRLNDDLPVVQEALAGPGPARQLCALELGRLLLAQARARGATVTVHELHQQLVAAREG